MEAFFAFAEDNLVIIIVAIIAIVLVISLVKTVLKWVIVAVVAVGILVYGFNYNADDLKGLGEKVLEYSKEEAVSLLIGDVKNAQYEQSNDGSFSIYGKNMRLDGQIGSKDLQLIVVGQKFNITLDDALQKYIDEVKAK